jgi:hypothetical protein
LKLKDTGAYDSSFVEDTYLRERVEKVEVKESRKQINLVLVIPKRSYIPTLSIV